MENYIAVVFPDGERASNGLHALWHLDGTGDITVHGAVIVKIDERNLWRVTYSEDGALLIFRGETPVAVHVAPEGTLRVVAP